MNDKLPAHGSNKPQNEADKPQRTPEQFAADQTAQQAAVQVEHGEAMTEEEQLSEINDKLMALATDNGEGEECLGKFFDPEIFPDQANHCLLSYQQKKQNRDAEYQVMDEPPKKLARILERGLGRRAEIAEESTEIAEQAATEAARVEERSAEVSETAAVEDEQAATETEATEEAILNDGYEKWKNSKASFTEMIQDAANLPVGEPPNPEHVAARARLMQFQSILKIVESNEADKAIVAASFAKVDKNNPPSAASFARSFIFDSPDSTIKTGVSEATQAAIAESLGIALPKEPPKTGGDVNDVYKYGGTETYTDENGEKKTRRVPLPKDARVPFTKESEIGFDQEGNKTLWVTTEGGEFNSRLPENPTDEDIGNIIRTVQLRGKLHALNIAHIVYPDVTIEEKGGGPITVQPWHYDITDRFLETVVSNRAVAGNNVLSQSDLDKIPHIMQFHDRKGDYGIADVNPDQTIEDYRAQGIIDKSGTFDWNRFTALVMANRANLYTEANFKANVENQPEDAA